MSNAVTVQSLTKTYRIGAKAAADANLRETISGFVMAPFRRLGSLGQWGPVSATSAETEFNALDNVSFDVAQGEVLGVIGRNGAGKSTLLKILSRITEPTNGQIELRGRIASLLEVGTGFHPELTGRENIYLNGAILGMKHREVQQKFDEIVAFSGIEKFLETPVKRYSSGMRVRLGFAVAAHLEFEVLIVDEVLAVGDAAFQKKCLGRMSDIASTGRTVIFVSHNLAVLQRLCPRSIWLRDGKLVRDGQTSEVVDQYLEEFANAAATSVADRTDRRGSGAVKLTGIDVIGPAASGTVCIGQAFRVRLDYSPIKPGVELLLGFYDQHGVLVTSCDSRQGAAGDVRRDDGDNYATCDIDEVSWTPGRYRLNVAIYENGQLADHVESACVLDVHEGVHHGRSVSTSFPGISVVPHRWQIPIK